MKRYLLGPADAPEAQLGGKARALAALSRAGFPIPPWVVLSPEAFFDSLSAQQRGEFENDAVAFFSQFEPAHLRLAPEIANALRTAATILCPDGRALAVRSSARDEDGADHSFAGQLETRLNVPVEEVTSKVWEIWASAFQGRVLAYRRAQGLSALPPIPAVLIQRMVCARAAGVAFSADPVSGRRRVAVVCAVRGQGQTLVCGDANGDTWRVDRSGAILERTSAEIFRRSDSKETETAPTQSHSVPAGESYPAGEDTAALNDDEAREVAALARRVESFFGRPQDVEWAWEDGRLCLLQARPITGMASLPDPDGALGLWDNSNITESYSGVTTPLTFSFARHAYEGVYRQFCRLMRVPDSRIRTHDRELKSMIGLIRGRIYYNLVSWYRILATLPGFAFNRRFMEQMMGVKEGVPEEVLRGLKPAGFRERFRDGCYLLRSLTAMAGHWLTFSRRRRAFAERLERALAAPVPSWEKMHPEELAAHYRRLERELLPHWDAPLINDFFAMICVGFLRDWLRKWSGENPDLWLNTLLATGEDVISVEPGRRLRALARLLAGDRDLTETWCEGDRGQIVASLDRHPQLHALYEEYLDKFSDRCLEELKLETVPLRENPLPLFRAAGRLARSGRFVESNGGNASRLQRQRAFESRIHDRLRSKPWARFLFFCLLRQARAKVRDRENLRFERTRVFGRVRRIFLEMGRRFHALGLIEEVRDVFYLEVEEILGVVEGASTTTNLRTLSILRKREFAGYAGGEPPPDRFATRGVLGPGESLLPLSDGPGPAATRVSGLSAGEFRGLGCSPGRVRGRVKVVLNPNEAILEGGEILVAQRTDPGWVMLFPLAAGLIVERGSLLSHSAIVARELGLPAVVGVAGAVAGLRDGDEVELDGATGVVKVVKT
jgi:rifampicin phosphotransferase